MNIRLIRAIFVFDACFQGPFAFVKMLTSVVCTSAISTIPPLFVLLVCRQRIHSSCTSQKKMVAIGFCSFYSANSAASYFSDSAFSLKRSFLCLSSPFWPPRRNLTFKGTILVARMIFFLCLYPTTSFPPTRCVEWIWCDQVWQLKKDLDESLWLGVIRFGLHIRFWERVCGFWNLILASAKVNRVSTTARGQPWCMEISMLWMKFQETIMPRIPSFWRGQFYCLSFKLWW